MSTVDNKFYGIRGPLKSQEGSGEKANVDVSPQVKSGVPDAGQWNQGKGVRREPNVLQMSEAERTALQAQTVRGTLQSLVDKLEKQPPGTPLTTMERLSMEFLLKAYKKTHPELVEASGVLELLGKLDQPASVNI